MAIHRTDETVLEEGQRELKLILDPGDGSKADALTVRTRNEDAINRLAIASSFDFAGRRWSIPVLSFVDGMEFMRCKFEVERMSKYVASGMLMDEYEAIGHRVAARLWQIVVPAGGWTLAERVWRRLGWMENPFLKMNDAELGVALGFCLMRRTTSTVTVNGSDGSGSERSARRSS